MDVPLGGKTVEVHDAADAVLRFWFDELTPRDHFTKDEALDARIAARFGPMREEVLRHDALGWRSTPDMVLAAIIVLDQFSRNIFRGDARAFDADPLALSLTRYGMDHGYVDRLPPDRAIFLLMPLMHAEHADAQAESLRQFEALGLDEQIRYARDHAEVIERFGRFPSRNAALGRISTPAEEEYLSQPGAGW